VVCGVGEVGVVVVALGSVVVVSVGVVVVVVVVVVVRRVVVGSCTWVRGTQVYSGSGTKPGGTTAAGGGVGSGASYAWESQNSAMKAMTRPAVDVRTRPPGM
jgi:hypothetical protein